MLTEKRFSGHSLSINYVEGPASGRPVVLLHGVTNRWQTWLPVLPLLGWRYHCYALDQRGHGRSGHATDGYQSEQFAQDVIAFLQDVVKRPVVLIGHSLGAMITMKVAALAPEWVEAIVLGDPPLSAAADGNGVPPPWFQQYLDILRSHGTRADRLRRLAELAPDLDPVAIQAQLRSLEMLDPEILVTGAADGLFVDLALADILPKISCPSLLIQGNPALGGVIEEQDVQYARPFLAHTTHIYVADMGHSMHVPFPNRFANLISNFIEGQG